MRAFEKHLAFTICAVAFCARAAQGQEVSSDSWFVRTGMTAPHIMARNPFAPTGGNPDGVAWVPDLTVEVGRQTNGSRQWHHLYNLPSYGVGFSLARFQDGTDHGQPLEAYAFFSWPFAALTDRLDLTTDFGMGLSWNWQQMDQKTAAAQTVLGSDMNARIDWGFYLRYLSTPRTSIYAGIDFTHRSNGGLVQPDNGINVIGPKVAFQYRLGPGAARHSYVPPPPFRPRWELLIGGAGGFKNVIETADSSVHQAFGVFHGITGVQRQFYQFGKITAGTDVTYDGAAGAKAELVSGTFRSSRASPDQRWGVGVYGGYEHLIGRFGVFADLGYTVARGFDDASVPRLYQRFGWRYRFNDRLWGSVSIRSIDGVKADSLAVGGGYRIRLSRPRTGSLGDDE